MQKGKNKDIKLFTLRLPKSVWLFLKAKSAEQEIPMAEIIVRCVEKYKKKFENKLTDEDSNI